MKKVFVCSPLRACTDVEMITNIRKAAEYCKTVAEKYEHLPIAPHVYFTAFLDDAVEKERHLGIQLGIELLKSCDELWVFGNVISTGMSMELRYCLSNNIPIKIIHPTTSIDIPYIITPVESITFIPPNVRIDIPPSIVPMIMLESSIDNVDKVLFYCYT